MSQEIPEWFVQQYTQGVYTIAQQKGSILLPTVDREDVHGKKTAFDRVGTVAAKKRTTRHGDTPQIDTPHSRRWLTLSTYETGDLIDSDDQVRTLNDPTNSYVQAHGYAMGRSIDDEIIEALRGTAITGEDGDGSQALPSAQKIAHNSNGLNLAKLREAKRKFMESELPRDWELYMAVSAKQIEDLLGETELTSADYNTIRTLVNGDIGQFMGFTFVPTERLPNDSDGNRACLAWAKPAFKMGIGMSPKGRIGERADKNYSTQVFFEGMFGGVRMEEVGVVEIACVES